jgi:hypothetical protein
MQPPFLTSRDDDAIVGTEMQQEGGAGGTALAGGGSDDDRACLEQGRDERSVAFGRHCKTRLRR